jgi:hypothetical protein
MGAEQSVPAGYEIDAEQTGGAGAEEELAVINAKPVSAVRRRSAAASRAKTHKAPSGRRNKTRKTK